MNQTIKLLIVEDDIEIQQQYKEDVSLFNDTNPAIEIIPQYAENLSQAENMLQTAYFDAAIVDLRLSANDEGKGGQHIISLIKKGLRFPIFIVSGFLAEASSFEEHIFLNKKTKGDYDNEDLLKEIATLCTMLNKVGISNILGRKGAIEEHLSHVFWNHISLSMPYWIEKANSGQNTEEALLRYTLTHLQEYLEISEQGEFQDYHFPEFYINPPIKNHTNTVFTADVVRKIDNNICYIVLTPSCDLTIQRSKTTPKVKLITLAEIELFEDKIFDEKSSKDLSIKDAIRKNTNQMYHYLPPFAQNNETLGKAINFGNLISIPLSTIIDNTKYKKEFAISNSFAKDIIARFSHYYARQGQPGFRQ